MSLRVRKGMSCAAMVLGLMVVGCGSLPGMGECKFATGELAAGLEGDAKIFMEGVLELKKLQLDWAAEMKAIATDLKVEGAEDAVIAKLQANFDTIRAKGKCTIDFSADVDLKAQLSAAAGGKASTGEGASGSADASGSAAGTVDVKIEPKCEAEGEVKAELDATINTLKVHLPKLFGIAKAYVSFAGKVPELVAKGEGALKGAATNLAILPEIKCAVEMMTGIKADMDVKVDFSVKVQASAKGEAAAGAGT